MTRPIKLLCLLLFLGLTLRLATMFYSYQFRENTDVLRYKDWGRIAFLHGLADTYKPDHLSFGTLANNQPPGSLYLISSMYYGHLQAAKLYLKFFPNSPETNAFIIGPILHTFLRIPQIVADLGIGILIFLLVKHYTTVKQAVIASSLFLFNPVIIYNSSFWGQMDSINNFFLILALYRLLKNCPRSSLLSYGLSLFVKLSLIFIAPLFLCISYVSSIKNQRTFVFAIFTSIITTVLLTLPISLSPHTWFYSYMVNNSLGEMQHITNFAFNFWWMIFKPAIHVVGNENLFVFSEVRLTGSPLDSTLFLQIPLRYWGVFLFILFSLPLYWKVIKVKKTLSTQLIFHLLSLLALLSFLFLPRMHERYLYPVFPLLAAYIGLSKKAVWVYVLLSIFSTINLYIVWHPMRLAYFPYELINSQLFQWTISVGIVVVASIWYIHSMREIYSDEKKLQ